MKNKAFTLIELLGVILILGLLVLIAFPPLLSKIKNSKSKISEATKLLIIDATKDYINDNENNFEKTNGMTYCIPISTLIENNYLNENLKDENLNNIKATKKIKLIYNNNNFNYEIVDSCTNNVLTRNDIEVPITTENDGLYKSTTDTDRFIYRGANPNNYIELNEGTNQSPNYVKYRIISFEADGTIKVVRNTHLGGYSWDEKGNRSSSTDTYCTTASSKGCSVWGNQKNIYYNGNTLEKLNRDFYYQYYNSFKDSSVTNGASGQVTKDSTLNTFLNSKVINSENSWQPAINLDKYIDEHFFNVGTIYYTINSDGDKGLKKEKQEESLLKWKGKIGLLNLTEFVDSSTDMSCTSVYSNYNKNTNYYYDDTNDGENNPTGGWPCGNSNYLANGNYEFTLTSSINNKNVVWSRRGNEFFHQDYYADFAASVRPAFYLRADIKLTGTGTSSDPYRINNRFIRNNLNISVVTQNDGLYEAQGEPNRYVYRGANPNNYIWLDENGDGTKTDAELYRIISFEKDGTIKVVRKNQIGARNYDKSGSDYRNNSNNTYCPSSGGCNVWGNQSNTYYNEKTLSELNQNFYYYYYPDSSPTTLLTSLSRSGTVTKNAEINDYLNGTWINSLNFKDKIETHSFNVGGLYYTQSYENGEKSFVKEKEEEKIYTWKGKVGLMNITEAIETSTNSSCTSVYSNFKFNYPNYYYQAEGEAQKTEHPPENNNYPCKSNNWMNKKLWSMTPYPAYANNVWTITNVGSATCVTSNDNYGIYPAFYLKSDINLTGSGTELDPYKIK